MWAHAALQRTGGAGNLASSIQEILAEVDKDGDGRIDYQEFCDMMRGQACARHLRLACAPALGIACVLGERQERSAAQAVPADAARTAGSVYGLPDHKKRAAKAFVPEQACESFCPDSIQAPSKLYT